MTSTSPDPIICLRCGGVFVQEGPPPEDACACAMACVEARPVTCGACGAALNPDLRACPYCQRTVATRRCSGCLAWNLAEARHCQACGDRLAEHAESEDAAHLTCPRCASGLRGRGYADLRVLECDACGGMMLDAAMMARVVTSRDRGAALCLALPKRSYRRELDVRYIACPVCAKSMNRRAFGRISGVVVDVCREHGVWFDAGELGEVLTFVERGGLEKARMREVAEYREAARSSRTAAQAAAMSVSAHDYADRPRPGAEFEVAVEVISALASLWS